MFDALKNEPIICYAMLSSSQSVVVERRDMSEMLPIKTCALKNVSFIMHRIVTSVTCNNLFVGPTFDSISNNVFDFTIRHAVIFL